MLSETGVLHFFPLILNTSENHTKYIALAYTNHNSELSIECLKYNLMLYKRINSNLAVKNPQNTAHFIRPRGG